MNGKMLLMMRKFGMEGYGFVWLCRELVSLEGKRFRIKTDKDWKILLQERSRLLKEKIEEMLDYQAKINLINHNALKEGDLYIPKLKEYMDNYTKRVRRVCEQDTDSVPLRYDTIRYVTKRYVAMQGLDYETLSPKDHSSMGAAVKLLWNRSRGDKELILEGMDWMNKQNYSRWTLFTLDKQWIYFLKYKTQKEQGAGGRKL